MAKDKKDIVEEKISSLKNVFINHTIFVLLLVLIPAYVSVLIRIPYSGITVIVVLEPILIAYFLFLYLLRWKIPVQVKTVSILAGFLLVAVSVFFTLGLLSMGVSMLLTVMALSSLYFRKKGIFITALISVAIFICFSFLWSTGALMLRVEPFPFLYSWSNWIAQILGFIGLALCITVSVFYMMKSLKKAIRAETESSRKMEELLKRENERLESLIEQRTAELEKTTRELFKKEQMASLGSLVAGVSHEINTPLGVAVTASTFLADVNKKAEQLINNGSFSKKDLFRFMERVEETSNIISRNLNTASNLVKNFKQISVNQSNPVKSKFNVKQYIETVILTLKHEYKRTSHTITVDMDENLIINSYPSAFSQIVTNFLMNSLIHGFDDMENGQIWIQCEKKSDTLILKYKDNGKGIPQEVIEQIFHPFFTTKRGAGGSGLGLSIVYNIVHDRLNGEISCQSMEGEGSEFIIEIPNA